MTNKTATRLLVFCSLITLISACTTTFNLKRTLKETPCIKNEQDSYCRIIISGRLAEKEAIKIDKYECLCDNFNQNQDILCHCITN
jgi:hypothetical protein